VGGIGPLRAGRSDGRLADRACRTGRSAGAAVRCRSGGHLADSRRQSLCMGGAHHERPDRPAHRRAGAGTGSAPADRRTGVGPAEPIGSNGRNGSPSEETRAERYRPPCAVTDCLQRVDGILWRQSPGTGVCSFRRGTIVGHRDRGRLQDAGGRQRTERSRTGDEQ